MQKTSILQLPVYNTPTVDEFNIADFNTANQNLEAMASGLVTNPAYVNVINQEVENARTGFNNLDTRLNSVSVNVKTYGAIGNANYYNSTTKKFYADAGFTIEATNDSLAIINALNASSNVYFPDGNYLITFSSTLYNFVDKKNIRLKGKGAYIIDGDIYDGTGVDLRNVFAFTRCENVDIDVNYSAIPLEVPTTNLGYWGAGFLYFEESCDFIKVCSVINHARYGVRSGNYSVASKGYCRNLSLRLKTYYTGYPCALYLAEHVKVDINAEGVHRASYFAGCNDVEGDIVYKGFAMATMNVLLTNSLTSDYTLVQADQRARGCSSVNLKVTDKGSTSLQSSRAMVGFGLQWVAQGTAFNDIKINLQAKTDDASRTLGGICIQSKSKVERTEYPFNWENYISFSSIKVTGMIDRTAQTIGNSSWGDIFIEGYDPDDMTYTHAPTFSNIMFDGFTVKKGTAPANNNFIRMPKLSDILTLRNVMASGINFTISTPLASTKIENCTMNNISSNDTMLKLIRIDNTLGTVDTSIVTNNIDRSFGQVSGVWTPKLEGLTTMGTNTYSIQKGSYIKTGKLVKLTFLLTLSAKDVAMAGNIVITGLPFVARDADERAGVSFSFLSSVTFGTNYTGIVGNITTNVIKLFQYGSGLATLDLTATGIANTSAFWGSVTYETSI